MMQSKAKQLPRIYFETPDHESAYLDGLIWDRYKGCFYSCENVEEYDKKYKRSNIKQFDDVPKNNRVYVKSQFTDIPVLKNMKARYEPIYKLWYFTKEQYESLKSNYSPFQFEPMYEFGHPLRF
jgi:hypothetical protein